jgi:hypothetical protein
VGLVSDSILCCGQALYVVKTVSQHRLHLSSDAGRITWSVWITVWVYSSLIF